MVLILLSIIFIDRNKGIILAANKLAFGHTQAEISSSRAKLSPQSLIITQQRDEVNGAER